MFDRDGEGFILIWELGFIMRFMGYVLIEVEFVDMINEVDFDGMCDVFFCEKCICINENMYKIKRRFIEQFNNLINKIKRYYFEYKIC